MSEQTHQHLYGICLITTLAESTLTHNGKILIGVSYIKRASQTVTSVFERILCLDVQKMMLSPKSQPVVRPLYNGGRIVLQGAHHHLLSMLVNTLILIFKYEIMER